MGKLSSTRLPAPISATAWTPNLACYRPSQRALQQCGHRGPSVSMAYPTEQLSGQRYSYTTGSTYQVYRHPRRIYTQIGSVAVSVTFQASLGRVSHKPQASYRASSPPFLLIFASWEQHRRYRLLRDDATAQPGLSRQLSVGPANSLGSPSD